MTVEHISAQSLLGNVDEIRLLIVVRIIDVVCVSESRLLPDITDAYVDLLVIISSDVTVVVEAMYVYT